MSDTLTGITKRREELKKGQLDDYLLRVCLERTVGEMMRMREESENARAYFAASLIYNAVFEKDIQAINQIVWRIDGTAPRTAERKDYANIFGDALDDVLDYDRGDQMKVYPDDLCIVAMAKVVIYIALQPVGFNVAKRKDQQTAIDMVLTRTQGRKTEPTKLLDQAEYVAPEWMRLPENKAETS